MHTRKRIGTGREADPWPGNTGTAHMGVFFFAFSCAEMLDVQKEKYKKRQLEVVVGNGH